MKKVIFLAVLVGLGWFVYNKMAAYWTQEQINKSAPVRYTNALQQDVKRAEDVAQKANAKIQDISHEVNNGVNNPEGQ